MESSRARDCGGKRPSYQFRRTSLGTGRSRLHSRKRCIAAARIKAIPQDILVVEALADIPISGQARKRCYEPHSGYPIFSLTTVTTLSQKGNLLREVALTLLHSC